MQPTRTNQYRLIPVGAMLALAVSLPSSVAAEHVSKVLSWGRFNGVATCSRTGRLCATAVRRNGRIQIEIVDTVKRSVVNLLPFNPISVAFLPNSKQLATAPKTGGGSSVCDLVVWDIATGKKVRTIRSAERISSIAVSPDGKYLAAGIKQYFRTKTRQAYGYGGILLFEIKTGRVLDRRLVPAANHIVRHVAYSADGKHIATAANRQVDLWVVHHGKLKHAKTLQGAIRVAFSPRGNLLACSQPLLRKPDSWVGQVLLLDLVKKSTRSIAQHNATKDATVLSIQFSRNGKSLLTAGFDGIVMAWDVQTGKVLRTISVAKKGGVPFAAFGVDDLTVITIDGEGGLRLWPREK